MCSLKDIRIEKKLTQQEVANLMGMSLRSYVSYENDETKQNTIKYKYLLEKLNNINKIDEEHGIIHQQDIIEVCSQVLSEYDVDYCYLFGSYAKGKATEHSDVDLMISTNVTGLKFYGLVEKLREKLHKKVDLIDFRQLMKNEKLCSEVFKDGIKIYG